MSLLWPDLARHRDLLDPLPRAVERAGIIAETGIGLVGLWLQVPGRLLWVAVPGSWGRAVVVP